MINIAEKHLNLLLSILSKYDYSFYLFGSRITDKATKFSDIDLFYKDNISARELALLEGELEESDLPYKVDIVDYNSSDPIFKKVMDEANVCIQERKD